MNGCVGSGASQRAEWAWRRVWRVWEAVRGCWENGRAREGEDPADDEREQIESEGVVGISGGGGEGKILVLP